MFGRLMPREGRFFDLFNAHAGIAGNIVWAWILAIPCSAFIAAVAWGGARAAFAQ